MAKITFKFKLTHPEGIAFTKLRVHTAELNKDQLYKNITGNAPVVAEGTIDAELVTGIVDVSWDAVGAPNIAGSISLKRGTKDLLTEDQGKVLIPSGGEVHTQFDDLNLPSA
ncbi:hypothetical protein [Mucilaginibacter sp. R-33]|uniref:hypothetical protein n=1 Tax=Mucilaginibacter sp. R-33 TaxID=3416711 RepID=UPI003CECA7E8